MHHETALIVMLAAGFGLAFVLGMAAHRVGLPPLVGYLLAGVAAGPFTPGFVGDAGLASQLAEIGVILLMFGVGLHFSLGDLLAVRKISLPGAVVQIAVATAAGALLSRLWGWPWGQGLVFGLSLSVASTVVLLRALEERGLVDSADGRIAVGWLIVEDLAMVLALVLLPALAGPLGGTPAEGEGSVLMAVLLTLGKVVAFLALMFVVGRRAVPWLLARVARTGSRELFTLSVLAVALGIAVGAALLFGVSFALGAFFAGVVISESDLSHQASADALPFQDAFAVLFFVSVGMLFDPAVLLRQPLQVLAVVAIILVVKSLAALGIVLAFRYPVRTALVVAASLAQIGEFSFILAGLGMSLGLLTQEGHSLILAGALLSITINPLIFATVAPIEKWVRARPRIADLLERPAGELAELPADVHEEGLRDHAVLVGHGRVGAPVGEALAAEGIPYVVVEQNREEVEALRARGVPALFGDASRPGILHHAHLERARLLIVSAPDAFQARLILDHARKVNPGIDTVVRTHSDEERTHLEASGVGRAVVGERELALAMVRYAFSAFGVQGDMSAVAARMLQLGDPHTGRKRRPTA
ncbi:YbaL family putative K(+) efflux transporter [Longimicrobium terrae]|uniref:CPA2 family monovalent cation:H+ antiporter-2 n=1 Tax=Longimicrobium terrae TaxID=1639882 RepID=A0A841H3X1_9BACT|nr:YbaL family putative K(+) efflux transporter [Longimicrobium terrae]MBB4638127.1 CPA2 family monovalent cation:H+ antiporter-2 [Longimicrobium terrae]MBB6072499.1 CPA2 family monovalent cation:H+ antiporter-2 [Longimicrobium terrae]NNC32091.1 Kef family K(+) transporter [Longimicrobium terrae]